MDDPFIRNYIKDLLKNIRTQVLLKLIKQEGVLIHMVLQVHRLLKSHVKDIKQKCQACSYFQKQKTIYAGIIINCNPPLSWISTRTFSVSLCQEFIDLSLYLNSFAVCLHY